MHFKSEETEKQRSGKNRLNEGFELIILGINASNGDASAILVDGVTIAEGCGMN